MINQTQVIESLKKEAASNPASNAVLHVWALRERARSQVTIQGLDLRMKKERFSFDKKAYEPLLRLMAHLGLGKLLVSSKGRIKALVDIKVTLQSIGKAAVGAETTLSTYRRKTSFKSLTMPKPHAVKKISTAPAMAFESKDTPPVSSVGLTIRIKSREVHFPLPADMTESEVATLVGWMRAGGT